jgi:hypothetical protein
MHERHARKRPNLLVGGCLFEVVAFENLSHPPPPPPGASYCLALFKKPQRCHSHFYQI